MTEIRWAIAILGWAVAGALAVASCGRGGGSYEQVDTLKTQQISASQITVTGGGSITLANGTIRIVDAQGHATLIDSAGVHPSK